MLYYINNINCVCIINIEVQIGTIKIPTIIYEKKTNYYNLNHGCFV